VNVTLQVAFQPFSRAPAGMPVKQRLNLLVMTGGDAGEGFGSVNPMAPVVDDPEVWKPAPRRSSARSKVRGVPLRDALSVVCCVLTCHLLQQGPCP
jgi:hypothetical protein